MRSLNIALLSMAFSKEMNEATKITTLNYAKELVKQGHNVYMITERAEGLKKYEKLDNVKIYRPYFLAPWNKKHPYYKNYSHDFVFFNYLLAHALGVRYVCKKEGIKFDIIHNFGSAPISSLRLLIAKLLCSRAKLVQTIKTISTYNRFDFSPGSLYYTKLLNLVNAITVSTNKNKEMLIANKSKQEKIHIVRSHINLSKFKRKNKQAMRRKYKLPRNAKVIFYYGPIWEKRGLLFLIDTLLPMLNRYENVYFILASRSAEKYSERHARQFDELKKLPNVRILFKEIRPIDYLSLSDLVVLLYSDLNNTEGNPSCILEAMASKTPLITTNLRALKEIISEKDALMIEPNDREQLKKAIANLLKNKNLQKRLTEHAYKTVQKFDTAKITKQFIKLYEGLLESS